jgi:hypothetical protein
MAVPPIASGQDHVSKAAPSTVDIKTSAALLSKTLKTAGGAALREGPKSPGKTGPVQPKPPEPGLLKPAAATAESAQGGIQKNAALSALLKNIGLPVDNLSALLASSFRYFSMTLDPALLKRLRGEAAKHPNWTTALAAAADKGVELSEESLAEYAEAIDPALPEHEQGRPPKQSKRPRLSGKLSGGALKELSEKNGRKEEFLNRLPGQNGRCWMVFPFDYTAEGIELRAAIRILLCHEAGTFKTERLAADIVHEQRRWLFVLEKPEQGAEIRVFRIPEPSKAEKLSLEKKMRAFFGAFTSKVSFGRCDADAFALDGLAWTPLSVNEAV